MKIFLLLIGSHLFSFCCGGVVAYMHREWIAKKINAITNVFK